LPKLQALDVEGTSVSDAGLSAAGLLDRKFSLSVVEQQAADERASAPDDAVPMSLDIVQSNRRLAAMRPDACLADLAVSLNNLGWGRDSEQGVIALQKAVAINRLLVARSEDHRGGLYNSLSNLGVALEKQGRYDEAISATGEAIEVFRQLPQAEPSTDVALNLQRLGRLYREADRLDEAGEVARESVEMFRRRAATLPNASMLHSWFVSSLNDLSTILHLLGRHQEAVEVITEAVEVSRRWAGKGTGSQDLVKCLKQLATILRDQGRDQEADAATREANTLQ
jgi:tetratricopeptide (TPR) repeat protein